MKKLILLLSITLCSFAEDYFFFKQWGLENTGQEKVTETGVLTQDSTPGTVGMDINWLKIPKEKMKKEIVVAVVDSGVAFQVYEDGREEIHPELEGKLWVNKELCKNPKIESKTKSCYGHNFLEDNNNIKDDGGHGTHVSGAIAASEDGKGVVGVMPEGVKIMALKVLSKNLKGFTYKGRRFADILADAINYAVKHKADVINLSMGYPLIVENENLRSAFKSAYEAKIPVVASSGNNNKNDPVFPCSYPEVICVGAMSNKGYVSEFSNFGNRVDLLAPGEGIVSTFPEYLSSDILVINGLELMNGSSQAGPFVAGVVAGIKSQHEGISVDEVHARLFFNSRKRNIDDKKYIHHGIVDMKKSIEKLPESAIQVELKKISNVTVKNDGSFSFLVSVKNLLPKVEKTTLTVKSSSVLVLNETTFDIEILENGTSSVEISGRVSSLNIDSRIPFSFQLSNELKKFEEEKIEVYFSMDDVKSEEDIVFDLDGINPKVLGFFEKGRKSSRLRPVANVDNDGDTLDFFFQERKRQKKGGSTVSILKLKEGEKEIVDLFLKKTSGKIMAVFKLDVNLDKKQDYFVYVLDKKNLKGVFWFFDENGKELFKHSKWDFPLTTFRLLPIKGGFYPNFSWVTLNDSDFGKIRVPALIKEYLFPEEDNTDDFYSRSFTGESRHFFFLKPSLDNGKVTIVPRVLDVYDFQSKIEKMVRKLGDDFLPWESVIFEGLLKNESSKFKKGELELLFSVGEMIDRRMYKVVFTDTKKFRVEKIRSKDGYVLFGNTQVEISDVDGDQSEDFILMSKQNRQTLRFFESETLKKTIFKTSSWKNIVFDYIYGAKNSDGDIFHFIDNRYDISVLKDGKSFSLPIARESSFQGIEFSETFSPTNIEGLDGRFSPGLFINSNLIYGDRAYVMSFVNGRFIRPISLAFKLRKNCALVKPFRFPKQQRFYHTLLCKKENGKLEIRMKNFSLKRLSPKIENQI